MKLEKKTILGIACKGLLYILSVSQRQQHTLGDISVPLNALFGEDCSVSPCCHTTSSAA